MFPSTAPALGPAPKGAVAAVLAFLHRLWRSLALFFGASSAFTEADDRALEAAIAEALRHRWGLDASRVRVSATKGRVSLRGSVAHLTARNVVEEIATTHAGEGQVDNRLQVDRVTPLFGETTLF